jgi:hypothetical protein
MRDWSLSEASKQSKLSILHRGILENDCFWIRPKARAQTAIDRITIKLLRQIQEMATYFADHFDIDPATLDEYGAFNVSLITDLPLFIDPFLLFNSRKPVYRHLHDEIIRYLIFLKNKSISRSINTVLLRAWYCFPEIKQNWLGFSQVGNNGSGLGIDFAVALNENLSKIFSDFGSEKITVGSHLEKVCLIRDGVGRDNISDFTTNLIKGFLCEYTQKFALMYLKENQRRRIGTNGVRFNYDTERWETGIYTKSH